MALRYTYDDVFLTDKIDDAKLEELENFYYTLAQQLNLDPDDVTFPDYVKSLVYCEIARRNIEAAGMDKKLETYQKKADELFGIIKRKSRANVTSVTLVRG